MLHCCAGWASNLTDVVTKGLSKWENLGLSGLHLKHSYLWCDLFYLSLERSFSTPWFTRVQVNLVYS